jgi:nucleoside 2-deoxyribosyltransferase
MKSIYFAGPDVFRADILEYVNYLKTICKTFDFTPLIPYEVLAKSTDTIFNRNIELIKQADIVVANVTPFRGTEPDSGTAW